MAGDAADPVPFPAATAPSDHVAERGVLPARGSASTFLRCRPWARKSWPTSPACCAASPSRPASCWRRGRSGARRSWSSCWSRYGRERRAEPGRLRYGAFVVPGTDPTDAFQAAFAVAFTWGFPFLIGRAYFTSRVDLRDLFAILAVAGLVYSLFILVEIRSVRGALAGSTAITSTASLRRSAAKGLSADGLHATRVESHVLRRDEHDLRLDPRPKCISAIRRLVRAQARGCLYLTMILLLCRSTASMLYGLILLGLWSTSSPRVGPLWVAVALAVLAFAYPALRSPNCSRSKRSSSSRRKFRERTGGLDGGTARDRGELTKFIQARPISVGLPRAGDGHR